ncbi:hypothetical protein [Magnetofaba australis]|nr:hypothetical protein [Magnetofaba australis]
MFRINPKRPRWELLRVKIEQINVSAKTHRKMGGGGLRLAGRQRLNEQACARDAMEGGLTPDDLAKTLGCARAWNTAHNPTQEGSIMRRHHQEKLMRNQRLTSFRQAVATERLDWLETKTQDVCAMECATSAGTGMPFWAVMGLAEDGLRIARGAGVRVS